MSSVDCIGRSTRRDAPYQSPITQNQSRNTKFIIDAAAGMEESDPQAAAMVTGENATSAAQPSAEAEGWGRVRNRVRPRIGVDLAVKDVWIQKGATLRRANDVKPPAPPPAVKVEPPVFDPTPVNGDPTFLANGFENLIVQLQNNQMSMQEVHLKGNRVTDEGCRRIAEVLSVRFVTSRRMLTRSNDRQTQS